MATRKKKKTVSNTPKEFFMFRDSNNYNGSPYRVKFSDVMPEWENVDGGTDGVIWDQGKDSKVWEEPGCAEGVKRVVGLDPGTGGCLKVKLEKVGEGATKNDKAHRIFYVIPEGRMVSICANKPTWREFEYDGSGYWAISSGYEWSMSKTSFTTLTGLAAPKADDELLQVRMIPISRAKVKVIIETTWEVYTKPKRKR